MRYCRHYNTDASLPQGQLTFGVLIQPLRRCPPQPRGRLEQRTGGDIRGDISTLGGREAALLVGRRRQNEVVHQCQQASRGGGGQAVQAG